MPLLPSMIEKPFNRFCDILGKKIIGYHISPNTISTAGFIVTCAASVLLYSGEFVLAGACILLSGLMDALDGSVARLTNTTSIFGAVYDAVLDRLGEMVLYVGLGVYLLSHESYLIAGIAVLAIAASFLISYVRARAESYNVSCRVGLLRRSERIVLLGLGSFLNFLGGIFYEPSRWVSSQFSLAYSDPPMPLTLVLFLIAILAPVTVLQRLLHVRASEEPGR